MPVVAAFFIPRNALMMPNTVPNSPRTAPSNRWSPGQKAPAEFSGLNRNSTLQGVFGRHSSPEFQMTARDANSCRPLLTTMANCDLRCLSLMLIASSMRSFFSAWATRGANSRDCFLAAEYVR